MGMQDRGALVLALAFVLVLVLVLVLALRGCSSDALTGAERKGRQGPEPEESTERYPITREIVVKKPPRKQRARPVAEHLQRPRIRGRAMSLWWSTPGWPEALCRLFRYPRAVHVPRSASPEYAHLFAPTSKNEADKAVDQRVESHLEAIRDDHERAQSRILQRIARGSFCVDLWIATSGAPVRRHVLEALATHPRLLVVGGRAAGKSSLVSFLAATAAERSLASVNRVPLLVPVERMEQLALDEREIARLNPAAGDDALRRTLEDGRAVVLVDGLDQAGSPDVLKESLAALTKRYTRTSFVVTTRPLPPRIAGKPETMIEGFTSARLALPEARSVIRLDIPGSRARVASTERVAKEVERLLARWQHASLLPDGGPCRFTELGALILWSRTAADAHHQREIEIHIDELVRDLRLELQEPRAGWVADGDALFNQKEGLQRGGPVTNAHELAEGIVRQLCERSELLVERRPGIFVFAELAFQEYLTAVNTVWEERLPQFIELRSDPWWHEVFVHAASLPRRLNAEIRPEEIIRALLEANVASDSVSTFLAARCAETARDLSEGVRRQIDRRLRAALPPTSSIQVIHLIDDVGDVAAPALVDALKNADANERAYIATTLGRLDYPPTTGVLAGLAADHEITTEPMLCWFWSVDTFVMGQPVSFFAIAALFNLALTNPILSAPFDEALEKTPPDVLDTFLRLLVKKLAYDASVGAEPSPERDLDQFELLVEKIVQASIRRSKQSSR